MSKWDLALQHLNEALEIRQRCLPPIHPYIAMSYKSLASYYSARNDPSKAFEMNLQALVIYRSSVPSNHSILAASYSSVGSFYLNQCQWQCALEHLISASNILLEKGLDRRVDILNDIDRAYLELGNHQQALETYQEALSVALQIGNASLAAKIEKNIENAQNKFS